MMTGTSPQDVQINFAGDLAKVMIGDSKFEITPDSRVVAYTDQNIESRPPTTATMEGPIASIGKDFAVAVYGARITKTEAGFTVQAASVALRSSASENRAPTAISPFGVGRLMKWADNRK